jgi:peptidoglycan/LPS O-acetylase OafA/YrhL
VQIDQTSTRQGFRPDLEGLRGVAILVVLACHLGLPGAGAGFIGVDIFFVLSGFLITGLLVGELEREGTIRLGAFYLRRARRILPAALLVLAASMVAGQVFLSPLDLPRLAREVAAAGASLANVHFAAEATDYFAAVDPSPVLHYWSLAVEEQFYLVWPALMLLAARLPRARLGLAVLTAGVLVGSFALSVWLTTVSGPWAYYSLPTRAWQLAAGALLAIAGSSWIGRGRLAAPMIGWLGVGTLLAAMGSVGPTTPYPGLAALLPTCGALAIIASGSGPGTPGRMLLQRRPLRWLGRISYSLYLWHWPVLVFGSMALGSVAAEGDAIADQLPLRLGLGALAVLVAILSWALVEEPFRRGLQGRIGPRRGLSLAATSLAVLIAGSLAMGDAAVRTVAAAAPPAAEDGPVGSPGAAVGLASATPSQAPRPSAISTATSGAPWAAPPTASATPTASPSPTPSPVPPPPARNAGPLPRGLTPALDAARDDDDPLLSDGCGLALAGSKPPLCRYGADGAALTIALVGDSHAAHLFPAVERLAREHGWQVVPYTKFSCVFVDMPLWSPHLMREYTECPAWREKVLDSLKELQPDAVLIVSNRWFPVMADRDNEPERQGAAMARLIERIDAPVGIIVDTPRSEADAPACLARHPDAIERCTTSRTAAFGWRHLRRETEAARLSGADIIDLSEAACPVDPCPLVIGDVLVYRDNHHLTATFAASLAGPLERALQASAGLAPALSMPASGESTE